MIVIFNKDDFNILYMALLFVILHLAHVTRRGCIFLFFFPQLISLRYFIMMCIVCHHESLHSLETWLTDLISMCTLHMSACVLGCWEFSTSVFPWRRTLFAIFAKGWIRVYSCGNLSLDAMITSWTAFIFMTKTWRNSDVLNMGVPMQNNLTWFQRAWVSPHFCGFPWQSSQHLYAC